MDLPFSRGLRGSAIHVFVVIIIIIIIIIIISYFVIPIYILIFLLLHNRHTAQNAHISSFGRPVVTSNIFTLLTWNKTDIVKLG